MKKKTALCVSTFQRSFSTVVSLLNNSFRIHTNKRTVTSENFRKDLIVMNDKLLYYINDYFKISGNKNENKNRKNFSKKRIGGLFPPCYSQFVFKFCTFMNNFDYISIPIPIKKMKQIKQKYSFFISENRTDIILCHPFYKHYIEEISFHLQIPFLICYDKPDILTPEQYLEDCDEGKETFVSKILYQFPDDVTQKYSDFTLQWESDNLTENTKKEMSEKWEDAWKKWLSENLTQQGSQTTVKGVEKKKDEVKDEIKDEESCITLQLSKESECDKSISFFISKILEQSQNLNRMCKLKETDIALIGIPANKIEYYDILFSLINTEATIIFPEVKKKKILHETNYMSWFKNHMQKNKENNFPVHKIIRQHNNFDLIPDFTFIDGASLFDEINNCEKDITVLILHNYLIRDFLYFWEHCEINKLTKQLFLKNKANKVNMILINGNEIRPGIDKKYIEKITNIFQNAKIYQRYILQEIGTICVIPLEHIEDVENIECQKNIAGYLMPNVKAEIDSNTKVLKVKINYNNTYDYNKYISENNKNMKKETGIKLDEKGFFKTKYLASINKNSLLTIKGYFNEIQNIPEEYNLYYNQCRDKMEKMPPGYLKRVRLHGRIWGNFHANKKNWKRKF